MADAQRIETVICRPPVSVQSTVTADLVASKAVVTTTIRLRFDRRSTTFIMTVASAAWINK